MSLLLLGIGCSDSGPTAQGAADLTVIKTGTGTATIVSSPTGVSCGLTCLASFTAGTVVTLSVAVDAGSNFNGWSGACGGTGSCVVTMDAARTVAASLVLRAPRVLSIGKRGPGGGTVTSSPTGISCAPNGGGECQATFPGGSTVTLTATPDAFSVFDGWVDSIPPAKVGECRGRSACTVTMDSVKTVITSFSLSPYLIQVGFPGAGTGPTQGTGIVTSSPAGISSRLVTSPGLNAEGPYKAVFPPGTAVTLNALPDTTSNFTGWSGACTGTGACVLIAANGPKSVGAAFTRKPPTLYKLTVSMTGEGAGGTWLGQRNYHGTYCFSWSPPSGVCEYSFESGAAVSLIAEPAEPYGTGTFLKAMPEANSYFTGWSGACTGRDPCTVIMNGPKSVAATFGRSPPYWLNVVKDGTGRGTVVSTPPGIVCGSTCTANWDANVTVTVTATPDTGSTFTGWKGSCTGTGICTVTMTSGRWVTATFTAR